MEKICKKIIENSPKKSIILFSPASPSFELYKNYIEA
jgi:UDP-N-acetylmuramoylalanine-D-glutamate ligase